MNDFEKEILSMLSEMKADISNVKADISNVKADISEMKEDIDITRTAANYNGEKLEELIAELKSTNTIL